MRKSIKLSVMAFLAGLMLVSCGSQGYTLSGVSRTRVLIDRSWDVPNAEAQAFMAPYSHTVDSLMGPVVGKTAHYMSAHQPESNLTNMMADMLVWAAGRYGEKPAFGIYNFGGIRAALSEGNVTIGDATAVAPFENKICFLTMKGSVVTELFRQIAAQGGHPISGSVRMQMTKGGELVSATIGGKEIDPDADYRVATIDYVAQGNDHLTAFLKATDLKMPGAEEDNTRYLLMEYFRDAASRGEAVSSKVEGRITIVE